LRGSTNCVNFKNFHWNHHKLKNNNVIAKSWNFKWPKNPFLTWYETSAHEGLLYGSRTTRIEEKRFCNTVLSSLISLQDPYTDNAIPQRIHVILQSLSSIKSTVTFIWILGHIGHPHHDAVDRTAKQATQSLKITDPTPSPAYDFKKLYQSRILSTWHQLWKNLPPDKLTGIKP